MRIVPADTALRVQYSGWNKARLARLLRCPAESLETVAGFVLLTSSAQPHVEVAPDSSAIGIHSGDTPRGRFTALFSRSRHLGWQHLASVVRRSDYYLIAPVKLAGQRCVVVALAPELDVRTDAGRSRFARMQRAIVQELRAETRGASLALEAGIPDEALLAELLAAAPAGRSAAGQ